MCSPRICFATIEYPPDVGGVARSAQRIATSLGRAGFEVHVFVPDRTGGLKWIEQEPLEGVWVHRVASSDKWFSKAVKEEDDALAFDLFHGFFLRCAYPCLEIAARGQRPVVASIRGIDGMKLSESRYHEALLGATWITSVSKPSLDRAREIVDISKRCSFIPNAIETSRFTTWAPTSQNRGVVGTVAAFRPKKNIPLLIEAYANLPAGLPSRLLLVGDFFDGKRMDDAAKAAVMDLISRLDLGAEVTITGYVQNDQVPDYLTSMGVFVLSSDHEGLPNSILEAAAAGMPIVSTAVDGVKDILTHEADALLVPPGDCAALASAIERVLRDKELACRLGAAALDLANRLSIEAESKAYTRLYNQLLVGDPGSPASDSVLG